MNINVVPNIQIGRAWIYVPLANFIIKIQYI